MEPPLLNNYYVCLMFDLFSVHEHKTVDSEYIDLMNKVLYNTKIASISRCHRDII